MRLTMVVEKNLTIMSPLGFFIRYHGLPEMNNTRNEQILDYIENLFISPSF